MFTKIFLVAAALLLSAGTAAAGLDHKDLRILNDLSVAVNSYVHFTIFDDVAVSVQDGVVTLTGKVTMGYKRDEIERRIGRVDGVREVRNQITVLPASTFDDELRQRIARAIYGNVNFWNYAIMPSPPIHIIVERSHVTLTGVVQSEGDRLLARALATQFGALSVTSHLKTNAEIREPLEQPE